MKLAKYTLFIELLDPENLSVEELKSMINEQLLNQCAVNGHCELIEDKSVVVSDEDIEKEYGDFDARPLNFINTSIEMWENEINKWLDNDELRREHVIENL